MGGGPSPPPQTKVTIAGKNEIYKRENVVGPFLVHKLLGPNPPPPLAQKTPCPLPYRRLDSVLLKSTERTADIPSHTWAQSRCARSKGAQTGCSCRDVTGTDVTSTGKALQGSWVSTRVAIGGAGDEALLASSPEQRRLRRFRS